MKIEQMQIDKLEFGIELLKELIAEVKSLKEVVQGLQLSKMELTMYKLIQLV